TGKPMLIKVPAVVAAERTRNSRRVTVDGVNLSMTGSFVHVGLTHNLRGPLYRNDDARICGAATEIAGHAVNDLLLGWVGVFRKQRDGLHNLTGLAVTALRHLLLNPGLLHRMGISRIEALNGGDHCTFHRADWNRARTDRLAVDMQRAATTEAHSAA